MKLLWMVGESHTFIYVSLALIKTTLIETAQDRILVFSLTNTNKSQDVKNAPNIQGSPLSLNIDLMLYAIEHDEYDWISKNIYVFSFKFFQFSVLNSNSRFRFLMLPQKDNRFQIK